MKEVTYALKDGVLVNILDVDSGLDCGCVCAGCGGQLVAKKGQIKAHHFAHLNAECEHAYESMIHYICKNAFRFMPYFELPKYDRGLSMNNYLQSLDTYISGKTIDLTIFDVKIEYKYKDIVADVALIYKGNVALFIEVANTHFIDEKKLKKIKEYGISCLEIDVRYFDGDISFSFPNDESVKFDSIKCRSIEIVRRFMEKNSYWILNKKMDSEWAIKKLKSIWISNNNKVWKRINYTKKIITNIKEKNLIREFEFLYNNQD